MPYKMFKQSGKFCVKNETTGESKGCSDSRATALGHMRALYAAEGSTKKELDDLIVKTVEDFNLEFPDEAINVKEVKDYYDSPSYPVNYVPYGMTSFKDLKQYRQMQDLVDETQDLTRDFNSMTWYIMNSSEVTDKIGAMKSLSEEFTSILDNQISSSEDSAAGKELDILEDVEKATARTDVSAADKKRAVSEYGNVSYADATNKKYPIDTEEHIRAALSYIGQARNQAKYSSAEVKAIKSRIAAAWRSKIDKKGPPSASTKELFDNFVFHVKDLFGVEEDSGEEDEDATNGGIMLWKEDSGQYRWIARYSNNFRDDDSPAEIISEVSHKSFIEHVEKGLAPMPVIELWHISEWKFGQADWLGYDNTGFALASGTVDKGLEAVAEWLVEQKDVAMSHGMPPWSVKYDTADPTVIVEHETKEISVLPRFAAANKLTGFAILGKETDTMIPKDQKAKLLQNGWNIDPALLDRLEQMNANVAAQAKEAGLESKENDAVKKKDEETVAVVGEAATTDEVKPQTTEKKPVETSEFPTRDEVVNALSAILTPFADRLDKMEDALGQLSKGLDALTKSDEAKIKQTVDSTPVASIASILSQRVIGSDAAKVDGRTSIANSKPKETDNAPKPTGISFIDRMITPTP